VRIAIESCRGIALDGEGYAATVLGRHARHLGRNGRDATAAAARLGAVVRRSSSARRRGAM